MASIQNYHRQILQGDVMDKLNSIPDNTFDCIITSPPYWSVRDYQVDGQIGLESKFEDYLKKLSYTMVQLKRVLKKTGSCWVNIGDTYAGGGGKPTEQSFDRYNGIDNHKEQNNPPKSTYRSTMEKSRFGIPERFYVNCIDNGWLARNHIPWIKSNAMPHPVKDRFTPKWESVYFFVKAKKYYFNLNAVRVKVQGNKNNNNYPVLDNSSVQKGLFGDVKNNELNSTNKQDNTLGNNGKPKKTYKGFNERWKNRKYQEQTISKINSNNTETGKSLNHPNGKNPGDVLFSQYSNEELLEWINLCRENNNVWDMSPPDLFYINPKPTKEKHHATFPIALPQYILKCACPKEVCVKCGTPKFPISQPTVQYQEYLDSIKYYSTHSLSTGYKEFKKNLKSYNSQYEIVGYDTCECNDEFIPGIVLDPFFGSGTTGIAAELEGVRWCGIELKKEYCDIARKRLSKYTTQENLLI